MSRRSRSRKDDRYVRWDSPIRQAHRRGRKRRSAATRAVEHPLARMDGWKRVLAWFEAFLIGDHPIMSAALSAGKVKSRRELAQLFNSFVDAYADDGLP
jgi:hypothetical protein